MSTFKIGNFEVRIAHNSDFFDFDLNWRNSKDFSVVFSNDTPKRTYEIRENLARHIEKNKDFLFFDIKSVENEELIKLIHARIGNHNKSFMIDKKHFSLQEVIPMIRHGVGGRKDECEFTHFMVEENVVAHLFLITYKQGRANDYFVLIEV